MAMKKMRLVSEAVYGKLFNLEHDPTEQLAKKKSSILKDTSIPDDVKPFLYNQIIRNITSKLKRDDQKPTQVAWEEEGDESEDMMKKKTLLRQWFETANISTDKANNLIIDGKQVPKAKFNIVKDRLLEGDSGKPAAGLNDIYQKMQQRGIPTDFFKVPTQKGSGIAKQRRSVIKLKAKKKSRRGKKHDHVMVNPMKKMKIKWKTY